MKYGNDHRNIRTESIYPESRLKVKPKPGNKNISNYFIMLNWKVSSVNAGITRFSSMDQLRQFYPIDKIVCEIDPDGEATPSKKIFAIFQRDGQNFLEKLHWGLVPRWANDTSIGYKNTKSPRFERYFGAGTHNRTAQSTGYQG